MIFGFNTDVHAKQGLCHVQTEDRGAKNPLVESIVYIGGKIVGRRQTPYASAEMASEDIEELVRRQHKELVEAIRSGAWTPEGDGDGAQTQKTQPGGYVIELVNAANVRDGQTLRFLFSIRRRAENQPAAEVALQVRWVLSGAVVESRSISSRTDGRAEITVAIPSFHRYGVLVVCAEGPAGRELGKFQVRTAEEASSLK